jgi:(p)ppGpp synthase/HD superfamily hydrolase
LALSKTQVDKLGDRLRKAQVPTDDDLRLLSDFREERRGAMDSVGAGLAEIVGTVPARRLKTINSIVDKLRRESARLSQVQDIAGLRIVRDMTRAEQDALVTKILARFPAAKVFDRRVSPSHGYRAVHVVATVDRHLVEVEVRTELQHRWASLVERFASAWASKSSTAVRLTAHRWSRCPDCLADASSTTSARRPRTSLRPRSSGRTTWTRPCR